MRTERKLNVTLLGAALLMTVSSAIAIGANPPATPPPAKKAKAPEPAPVEKAVAYDELPQHIGERVVVHTKFRTTRTGVLAQASMSQLTLRIESSGGPTEMTIPKDTVQSVAVIATPAPAAHEPGTPSAKKN